MLVLVVRLLFVLAQFVNWSMKIFARILFFVLLTNLFSCSSYNYNHRMSEYPNDFLFSQENIDDIPEDWKFFIHDESSSVHTLSKPNVNKEHLLLNVVEKSTKTVPKTLIGNPPFRKKELHIFIKEKDISPNLTIKIEKKNIDKIVTIGTPEIESMDKPKGMSRIHWIILVSAIISLGLGALVLYWIFNFFESLWSGG